MEREGERDTGPEELQTDTSLLIACAQCQIQQHVFRKPSMCFFLVRLIKAFGLSIGVDVCKRAERSSCHLLFALLVLCAPVVIPVS